VSLVTNNEWLDLSTKARLALRNGQPIDTRQSHVQVIFEPSFDDHLSLQLNWEGLHVKWYRTTWSKNVDAAKFEPIENLKYIGQRIGPTLKYEKGEIEISMVAAIIEEIRNTAVKPHIDRIGQITLDGCYHTLLFGVEDFQTVYKWHSASKDWQDLQKIADNLYDLNASIPEQ
jgi:hypothetical protein